MGVRNNDPYVLEFLANCTPNIRYWMSAAIEEGLRDVGAVNEGVVLSTYKYVGELLREAFIEEGIDYDERMKRKYKPTDID
jgi:hypothetical protein